MAKYPTNLLPFWKGDKGDKGDTGDATLGPDLANTSDPAKGAALVGYKPAGTSTQGRTASDFADDFKSMFHWFSAAQKSQVRSRGTALDLSVAMQAAIDDMASNGGGVIFLPRGTYYGNVVLKGGVVLTSFAPGYGYLPSGMSGVVMKSAGNGFVVDTPSSGGISVCGVAGINFSGLGAGTAGGGVRLRNVSWGFVKGAQFDNFADQAVLKEAGNANVFEDILTTNVLLNRTRSAKNGCVEVTGGADDFLHRIEANPSLATVSDANLRICGIVYAGTNGFLQSCIGEFSDTGIYIGGSGLTRLSLCRADLNKGNGFEIVSGSNQFTACLALRNSQAAHNTYDSYVVSGLGNQLDNCRSISDTANRVRYGFNDSVNNATVSLKNTYTNPRASGAATADYLTVDFAGSTFTFPSGPPVAIVSGTTTPSVKEQQTINLNNTAATTITNFADGLSGQIIEVYVADDNTTIQAGSGISGISMKLKSGVTYRFIKNNGVWRWIDPRNRETIGADIGDAGATLTVGTSDVIQIVDTPLTASRTLGLSGSGAKNCDRFRVVRTANSTGASGLAVGTLKTLATGQWCEVGYNGSAWVLIGYGTL